MPSAIERRLERLETATAPSARLAVATLEAISDGLPFEETMRRATDWQAALMAERRRKRP